MREGKFANLQHWMGGRVNDVNNNIWSKDSRCPKTFGQYCGLDMKDIETNASSHFLLQLKADDLLAFKANLKNVHLTIRLD